MDFLPKELEDIIIDYKESMEIESQRILDLLVIYNTSCNALTNAYNIYMTSLQAVEETTAAYNVAHNTTDFMDFHAMDTVRANNDAAFATHRTTRDAYITLRNVYNTAASTYTIAYATTDEARDAAMNA